MKKVNLLNIEINDLTLLDLLEKTTEESILIVTPNVDHLVKLKKDTDFLKIYHIADYVVCDSKIIEYVLKLLGTPIQEKISGSDLFPAFYKNHKDNQNIKIFILGGAEGVAQQARVNINNLVGREIVIDALSPSFGFEKNEAECLAIVEQINSSGANVLAIGVGAPKQEKWILKYRHLLPQIKVYLPVGATIDFEAGNTSRSPKWMSNVGLEWFYRLAVEPKRLWKRYLVDSIPFFVDIVKYRFNKYTNDPIMELKSLPLGKLLYRAGLISKQELDLLLRIQKERAYSIKLGEIAIELGLLSPETVTFFSEKLPIIIEQKEILSIEEYLQQANLITSSQLELLKQKQSSSSQSLSELIREENYVSLQTLDWFAKLLETLKS